jgi:MFS family permease
MSSEAANAGGAWRLRAAWRSGPLVSRDFRLLSVGQFTSTVGDFCYAIALPWLILSTHGGPVLLGTVLACYGVPRTVLIPVGGILADKIGGRTVMLAADVSRCILVALLAVLATRSTVSLVMLGPIAALLGAGEGVFLPASFTIMPSILEPDKLQAGNALSSAMIQIGSLAGPVLGGILVTTAGPGPAFAVDAASFAISALALTLIRLPRSPAPGDQPGAPGPADRPQVDSGLAASELAESGPAETLPDSAAQRAAPSIWSLLRRSRLLQIIVGVCIAANLSSGGTFDVALPALAHARFGAAGYGALIACMGAGSVIGTLAAARGSRLRRPAFAACSAFLVEAAATCLVPFLGGLTGAAAAVLVFGICNGFGNIVMITLLQQWAPSQLLGRVMSLVMLASMGTFPASVAVSGILVRHLGPSPFFPVAGIVLAVSILGALTQRQFREFGAPEPDADAGESNAEAG